MTNLPSMDDTLKAAEQLMRDRLSAVEAHKKNVDAEQAAREALAERERESARTWAAMLAAGWTAAELKRLGFKEPSTKASGRPRTSRARAERNNSTPTETVAVPAQATAAPATPPMQPAPSVQ
ncbi:hypothetical protein [Streptomyces sp. NPDC001492]